MSPFEDFTPEGYQRFEAFLDDVYAGFKDRVAQGRKLDAAAVESVAKGRIWSGEDAKAHGLVDALGGYANGAGAGEARGGHSRVQRRDGEGLSPAREFGGPLFARLGGGAPRRRRRRYDNGSRHLLAGAAMDAIEQLTAPPGALVMAPVELR